MRALFAVLTLLLPALARADERWLEVTARPRTQEEAIRLLTLGFEVKEGEDGAASVFLTAAALPDLERSGVPFVVVHGDLEAFYAGRLLEERRLGAPPARLMGGTMGGYFTWSEAVAEMDALVATYPGLLAPRVSIGTTGEGRDIWAWKLSANVAVSEPEPAVLFMALMHAREPEGMMSLLWLTGELLAGYGTGAEATYLLEHREIWVVPVLNADGYVYNETQSPNGGGMWRKNRRDNGGGSFGVDPNRNFAFEWGVDDQGSSPNRGSDTYRGPSALSEPETQALRDFAIAHEPALSINTHTYGDLVVSPWGYVDDVCADAAVFNDLARLASRGTAYTLGNMRTALGYLGNGSHDDYMWGEEQAKPRVFGFTPELGNAADGFWPATSRIDPIRREAYPMHKLFAWAAGSAPSLEGYMLDDAPPGGDGDGFPERGESVLLTVSVRNHGLGATLGPLAARIASSGCAVIVEDGAADLGDLTSGSSGSNAADPFVVRITDDALPGDLAPLTLVLSDAGGDYPAIPLSPLVGEPVVIFADDFESGLARWTASRFGLEGAGAGRSGMALSDSLNANYGASADATAALSAPLDLTAFARAWLVFEQRFRIDNDFDAAMVEAAPGTSPWTALPGESSDVGSGSGAQTAGAPVYDGYLPAWTAERVDLSAYAGPAAPPLPLRFRLRSNGSIGYDGWRVDDVRVIGFPAAPAVPPPNEPRLLLAVKRGPDAVFTWTPPLVDGTHGAASGYELYRSPAVRANGGFAPLASGPATATTDPGAVADGASYAYVVVAGNCAGTSPLPPP